MANPSFMASVHLRQEETIKKPHTEVNFWSKGSSDSNPVPYYSVEIQDVNFYMSSEQFEAFKADFITKLMKPEVRD